jgi:hypothetical protein
MIYPAYRLNPGDMFQVDPERVLLATGEPKNSKEIEQFEADLKARLEQQEEERAEMAENLADLEAKLEEAKASSSDSEVEPTESESSADRDESTAAPPSPPEDPEVAAEAVKRQLKAIISSAKDILSDPTEKLNVKRKQELRFFTQQAKRAMARANRTPEPDKMMDELAGMLKDFRLDQDTVVKAEKADATEASPEVEVKEREPASTSATPRKAVASDLILTPEEQQRIKQLLSLDAENPIDESKPYRTPWVPRRYLAPFAFIPRYLEVNQNICAAVYLRHPVARPGLGEVPTPFPYEVNQLAFNWYLRRS